MYWREYGERSGANRFRTNSLAPTCDSGQRGFMSFDPTCVFCKIAKGTLPAFKVFEDENFIAFLDKFPQSLGHCQIIPKEHVRWVWDVPNIGAYMEAAQTVAKGQRKAFGTDMIVSHIIGDEVFHAHIWLVPQGHTKNQNLKNEEEIAQIIRKSF